MPLKTSSFHAFNPKTSLAALALGAVSLLSSTDASACGGLFCSNANPVNQAAERIIFAQNDDGTVSAAIEILYEGPAHEFAWVLPVPPGEIDVKVSSKQALDALQQASNPVYRLNVTFEDGCEPPPVPLAAAAGNAAPMADSTESGTAAPDVEVVDSGNAGPYDWEQISVNPDLEDRADVAVQWLTDNGYDVSDLGPETLRNYLDQDMNLVAFKLSKSSGAGSVRPILITYQSDAPTIPIQPTAVAANEDTGVMVWVLGDARAVPTSYYHLELNEALINWFSPGPTYNDVVIAAADEAGGHGFVTEQAGDTSAFSETIYPSWKSDQWEQFRVGQFDSIEAFLMAAQSIAAAPFINAGGGFAGPLGAPAVYTGQPQYDGFLDVLSDPDVVPLREGATPEQLNACISCYFEENVAVRTDAYPSTDFDPATDPLLSMDVQAFLDKMDELVIAPLADTQAMLDDHKKITRLYTTLSPNEMTVDPVFEFNADLEDFDNLHQADQVMQCTEGEPQWSIELPQGMVIEGNDRTWPITLESGLPVNFRVIQLSTETMGEVIEDNTKDIAQQLLNLGVGTPGTMLGSDPAEPDSITATDPTALDETSTTDPQTSDSTSTSSTDDPTNSDPQVDNGSDMTPTDMADMDSMSSSSDSGGCSVSRTQNVPRFSAAWLLALGVALLRRRRNAEITKTS